MQQFNVIRFFTFFCVLGYGMSPKPVYTESVSNGHTNIFVGGYFNNVSHALKYNVADDNWEHLGEGPIQEPWLGFVGAITVKKSIFPAC